MKVILYISLFCHALGQDADFGANSMIGFSKGAACDSMKAVIGNETMNLGEDCSSMEVSHSESVSGGYCLASLVAAGYYRAASINPVFDLVLGLSGQLGITPVITGTNSGGTMFIVRYFAFRDLPDPNKWTYPCYLLRAGYRSICWFHGNFGLISEECYSESQNLIGVATGIVYGGLQMSNGGPLGVVASYCSVYFQFLSSLPIPPQNVNFVQFWVSSSHWNTGLGFASDWTAAYTVVNPLVASSGTEGYNYGFDSYLSRGFDALAAEGWFANMSVYSIASISANIPSGISLLPFSFVGKQWENTDDRMGTHTALKVAGLILSYVMLRKLTAQHTILSTSTAPQCESGCPLLDGGFTDNGPVTPVLARASRMQLALRPRNMALLGPSNTMDAIKYLMAQGPLSIWTGFGLNLCPFTQVNLCDVITTLRELSVPMLDYDVAQQYHSIDNHYQVTRPDQQVMMAYCGDPLIFDHFKTQCDGNSACHMFLHVIPGILTDINFSINSHLFVLTMVWLRPTKIAGRFVDQYVPSDVRAMKYYANMDTWFPDFVATAPQKGGLGFTKVAGHSLLDYLTFLVVRLLKITINMRHVAYEMSQGNRPACGYHVFQRAHRLTTGDGQNYYEMTD